ncbi:MAG: Gliding motility regulatory protein [Chlamydiae bacterium]|nr:Gliding motility regulatory protein [Chlamydiota bacterium]
MPIEEEKKQLSTEVSSEMVKLFLGEFTNHFEALTKGLENESVSDINQALTSILCALKIIHLDSVIPLVTTLQKGFAAASSFPTKNKEKILHVVEILSAFLKSTQKNLYQVVEDLEPKIQEGLVTVQVLFDQKEPVKAPEPTQPIKEVDTSLLDLFFIEVESQVSFLNQGLLLLESQKGTSETYGNLMRAAHSLKGASRVVELDLLVNVGHEMEDCFILLEKQPEMMSPEIMDILFLAVDFFDSLTQVPKEFLNEFIENQRQILQQITSALKAVANGEKIEGIPLASKQTSAREEKNKNVPSIHEERILRVGSKSLNSLMGLAGESLVESLWLQPFVEALANLKHIHTEIAQNVVMIRESLKNEDVNERVNSFLSNLQHDAHICQQSLDYRLSDLEMFIRRHASLSERLYGEVIDIRMRPLMDGVKGFPRIVRDLGRDLGKKVRLEIIGETTPVDRDILEKLETPLMHLLRNSVDHGIETPEERIKLGKPEEGIVTLEATHRAGMLYITVTDDGRGVDIDKIKQKVADEKIVNQEVIGNLNESELLDFLYLPGFSTAVDVTDISGRGVGLNIVQKMIQEVGGTIRTTTSKGHHLSFHLQLPLTLSVIRAFLVEIAGEPYAFPLARIVRSVHLSKSKIEVIENRQYFHFDEKNVGLVQAAHIFELENQVTQSDFVPVIILNDRVNHYGVVVDKFIGEKDLVVQEIDPLLGKMPGISAGAFTEDGSPLLIIDVEDMLRSIDKLLYDTQLEAVSAGLAESNDVVMKKILVVDDSITVREVEFRLLQNKGYEVQTAVDGVDGWNAVRIGQFDLVITDVDMPRMNGIDLVMSIKADPRLKSLPVMIVSYKDRESDRQQGLEAGADYYLTKASFHDETLVEAVMDLIGSPNEARRKP